MRDSKFFSQSSYDGRWIFFVIQDGSEAPPEIHMTDTWGLAKVKTYVRHDKFFNCPYCDMPTPVKMLQNVPKDHRKCQYCGELIRLEDIVSKFDTDPHDSYLEPIGFVASPLFLDIDKWK